MSTPRKSYILRQLERSREVSRSLGILPPEEVERSRPSSLSWLDAAASPSRSDLSTPAKSLSPPCREERMHAVRPTSSDATLQKKEEGGTSTSDGESYEKKVGVVAPKPATIGGQSDEHTDVIEMQMKREASALAEVEVSMLNPAINEQALHIAQCSPHRELRNTQTVTFN